MKNASFAAGSRSFLGLVGLALVAGCSAPVENGGGPAATDGPAGVATDDVVCNLQHVEEPIRLEIEKVGLGARVIVSNTDAGPAHVTLGATVFTSEGAETFEEAAVVDVPGGSSVAVELTEHALGIETGDRDVQLILEARAAYADGRLSGTTAEERLSRRLAVRSLEGAPRAPVDGIDLGDSVAFIGHESTTEPSPVDPGAVVPRAIVTKALCFDATITIAGAGQGEDFWTSNSLSIDAKGQEFWGLSPSNTWTQFKADENGCVPAQQIETGAWSFRAYSMGTLAASSPITIQVYDTAGLPWFTTFAVTITNSTATQAIAYTAVDQQDAFHIARASLRANSNSLTSRTLGKTLLITDGAAATNGTAAGINLQFTSDENKWSVSHEVGHWVEFNETVTHTAMAYNSTLAGPPPLCAQGSSHLVTSREFTSAAHTEGFASFFAATVFNDRNQQDCWVRLGGAQIDCAENATHAMPYMESACNDGSSFAGHGNETDWQRFFWDMVRPWPTATQATVRQLLDFVNTADAPTGTNWSATNHYTLLNTASNAAATPDHVETRWDTFAGANGIDH